MDHCSSRHRIDSSKHPGIPVAAKNHISVYTNSPRRHKVKKEFMNIEVLRKLCFLILDCQRSFVCLFKCKTKPMDSLPLHAGLKFIPLTPRPRHYWHFFCVTRVNCVELTKICKIWFTWLQSSSDPANDIVDPGYLVVCVNVHTYLPVIDRKTNIMHTCTKLQR